MRDLLEGELQRDVALEAGTSNRALMAAHGADPRRADSLLSAMRGALTVGDGGAAHPAP